MLKELFSHSSSSTAISEDKLYRYIVLLRSLPDTVARAQDGYIEAAKSLKELIVGLLSSWISVLAGFPTLVHFFRSKRKP